MNIIHVVPRTTKLEQGKFLSPIRYSSFQKILSKDNNFSFIPYEEFTKGLKSNTAIQHYSFDKNKFKKTHLKPLEAQIAQIEYYDAKSPEQKMKDMNYIIPQLAKEQNIKLINSAESLKSQDKKFLFDSQDKLIIKPPQTYYFTSMEEVKKLMTKGGNYVIKPRFGSEGKGVEQLNEESLQNVKDISKYVIQDEQKNILGELRLVYGLGKFLGSRFMLDRKKPWERKKDPSLNRYFNIPIKPSEEIIKYASQINELSKCEFSSVDLYVINTTNSINEIYNGNLINEQLLEEIISKPEQMKFVEVNGFGTGYGNPVTKNYFKLPNNKINDLNETIAHSIEDLTKQL